jgi:hypothetical protein
MGATKQYLLEQMWLEEILCPVCRDRQRTERCDFCGELWVCRWCLQRADVSSTCRVCLDRLYERD